jgi:hypothetical protein
MFAMLGISFLQGLKKRLEISRIIGALIFLISGLGLIHVVYAGASGIIGRWIAVTDDQARRLFGQQVLF